MPSVQRFFLPVLLILPLACTPQAGPPRQQAEPSADSSLAAGGLVSSLQVEVRRDSVRMILSVTNFDDEPLELVFPTAQRFDFTVRSTGGQEIWRWSSDRGFAQVVESETLAPGQTVQYEAVWQPGEHTGELVAEGRLAASPQEVTRSTRFVLPTR